MDAMTGEEAALLTTSGSCMVHMTGQSVQALDTMCYAVSPRLPTSHFSRRDREEMSSC